MPMLFYCFMIKFLLKMAGRNYRSSRGTMNDGWAVKTVLLSYHDHICISVGISPELEMNCNYIEYFTEVSLSEL